MVTRFDVIRSRWSSHFLVKISFFSQLRSTIIVKIVDKMVQSSYLCVLLHVKHKKLPFLAFLAWFLTLGKIQDDGQDGDHCLWRHRPPVAPPPIKYTSSCWEDQWLSIKGKNSMGGSINPLPLVPRRGYEFAFFGRPRVK